MRSWEGHGGSSRYNFSERDPLLKSVLTFQKCVKGGDFKGGALIKGLVVFYYLPRKCRVIESELLHESDDVIQFL